MIEDAADGIRDTSNPVSWVRSFGRLLQAELSPYPGRILLTSRIVMACVAVMLCITVFRIPGGVLGAYCPVLISRDNLRATKRSAFWVACLCTIATLQVLVGAMLCAGSPDLHLLWVWLNLFAIFYLISIARVYEAALACGMFLTNNLGVWDLPHSADFRVRHTLFMFLAMLLGCVITVFVEYLFSRTHPVDAVIAGIRERLQLTEDALRSTTVEHKLLHALHRYSNRGTLGLQALIEQSSYPVEEQQGLELATALAGRLIDSSIALLETTSRPVHVNRDERLNLSNRIRCILDGATTFEHIQPITFDRKEKDASPALAEIERSVTLLEEGIALSPPNLLNQIRQKPTVRIRQAIFADDALTNATHLKFALRGGLSAILCYMLYMSVGWTALNASVATCVLTALPLTGATRHKQLTRFSGIVLGACALGFAAQILILPQIDSILSYALLFGCVVFIGAWISTSTPRIAYCGAQIVLAFEIVNVSRFSINPSLIAARDAVLGIVLGIAAMWLVFDHLWAKTTLTSLRALLIAAVREIAEMSLPAGSPKQERALNQQTEKVLQDLNRIALLANLSRFESFPRAVDEETTLRWVKSYLPTLRAILLAKTGLLHHDSRNSATRPVRGSYEARRYCTDTLSRIASRMTEGGTSKPLITEHLLRVASESDDTLETKSSKSEGDDVTERLSNALVALTNQLQATSV